MLSSRSMTPFLGIPPPLRLLLSQKVAFWAPFQSFSFTPYLSHPRKNVRPTRQPPAPASPPSPRQQTLQVSQLFEIDRLTSPSSSNTGPQLESHLFLSNDLQQPEQPLQASQLPKPKKATPALEPNPPLSFLPPASNDPQKTVYKAPLPSRQLLTSATTTLLPPPPAQPPRFIMSAPRFLHLPRNNLVPEICLIGRSNVGKSTLLNALAGLGTAEAGRTHGAKATKLGLALTSKTAGSTTMMNVYGFGKPSVEPLWEVATRQAEEELWANKMRKEGRDVAEPMPERTERGKTAGAKKLKVEEKTEDPFQQLIGFGTRVPPPQRNVRLTAKQKARSEAYETALKRLANHKTQLIRSSEPAAGRYSLLLVDMPGYGHSSQAQWGAEIAKYLSRRPMLCGAVLLIDTVAGMKPGDKGVLRMLRDAKVRTTVVLTKADKAGYGRGPSRANKVKMTVQGVWDQLRKVDDGAKAAAEGAWVEGHGWEREVWVTGAGDPSKKGGLGVDGVRLAICKMAGLIEDDRTLEALNADADQPDKAPPKIVSFDQVHLQMESPRQVRANAIAG